MALTDTGSIYTWGGTLYGKSGLGKEAVKQAVKYKPRELEFFRNKKLKVTHISCGQNHSLAIAVKIKPSGRAGRP